MRRTLILVVLVISCQSGAESAPGSGSPAEPGKVSRQDCAEILDKADKLIGHDSTTHPREPAKRESEIDECVANATPAMLACAKAAATYEQLRACEKR